MSAPTTHRPRQVNVTLTGSLIIAWTGSTAGGCAAAGVCGVSGSIEMHLGDTSGSSSGGSPPLEVDDSSAVARVQTIAPDGAVLTCADLVPVSFNLAVRRTGGAPHATVDAPTSMALPSAGRCAGPTGADLSGLSLPARPFGAHGYDMSGQSSFSGGPFQVTAFSTVHAHITYGRGGGPPPLGGGFFGSVGGTTSGSVKSHRALEESATVVYRATGFHGALTTDFSGLASPLCEALGACGAAGRLAQSLVTHGTLSFSGTRIVHRRVGSAAALADLRHGRLKLSDTLPTLSLHVRAAETIAQSDGVMCRGTSTMRLYSAPGRVRAATDQLTLSPSPGEFSGAGADPFRTLCPGPSTADIVGAHGRPMATATISAGRLGDRQLRVVFSASGRFTGSAYRGERSGSVVLSLSLVRRRGVTRRVRLFSGEPPLPLS